MSDLSFLGPLASPETREQFLRRLLSGRHALLHAIVQANAEAIARLRPEASRPEAAPLLNMLRGKNSSAVRLRRCMAAVLRERPEHEGVIVPWALDFRLPRHRLALLPPEIALRLARWCGLALHRTEILNLMKKEDVLALRKEVGEEGHAFVLRRSALLPIPSRCDLDEKVFPEGALLSLRIRNSGFTAMALCLADAPAVVASMAHRCASPDFAALLDAARARASLDTARDARTHWPLLFTLIRREVAPIWAPCFF